LLIYFSTLVTVVIIAVSYILYVQFVEIEKGNVFEYSEESLSQISTLADSMLENAKMAISQVLLDNGRYKVFNRDKTDPVELKTITDRINLIASMPFLHSVYLYNEQLDLYYSSNQGVTKSGSLSDPGIVDIMKNYDPSLKWKPITRTVKNTMNFNVIDYNVYTFIYYDSVSPGSNNAIILNISDTWMKNSIATLDKRRDGGIFIMDSKGLLVSSVYKDQMLSDLSRQEFAQTILQSGEESGHFIGEVEGAKSLVTYASSESLGWKFVRHTPYQEAVREINKIRTVIFRISLTVMVVGLTLAYITSRRLNRPVKDMIKKLMEQNQTILEHSYKAKQDFLRQLLVADGNGNSAAGMTPKRREFAIKLDMDGPVRLVLFRIDRFKDFTTMYSFKDRSLLQFGIMNIASEIVSAHTVCETMDPGGDHTVLVFQDLHAGDVREWAEEIQHNVRKHLKLSVTVAVSPPGNGWADWRSLYQAAIDTSHYRVFSGWESVLYADHPAELSPRQYRYPIQKEEQLTDSLMLGRMEEVRGLCLSILSSTEGYSYKDLQLTMFRLFFAIQMVADTLEKASGFGFSIRFSELYVELSELERLEDMKEKFMELFRHMEERIGEKKNAKYDELMRTISGIIDSQYMKEDLSLDTVADSLNMSPVYLGRLFKKYASKSLTDYINEVRISKAEVLLRDSDKLIAQIAVETGFAGNSYFGKVFKKYKGVSPNEYRNKLRGSGEESGEEEQ
jgi:AraC-like DNA-binding protein